MSESISDEKRRLVRHFNRRLGRDSSRIADFRGSIRAAWDRDALVRYEADGWEIGLRRWIRQKRLAVVLPRQPRSRFQYLYKQTLCSVIEPVDLVLLEMLPIRGLEQSGFN